MSGGGGGLGGGGAVVLRGGELTLTTSVLHNNKAIGGRGGSGAKGGSGAEKINQYSNGNQTSDNQAAEKGTDGGRGGIPSIPFQALDQTLYAGKGEMGSGYHRDGAMANQV